VGYTSYKPTQKLHGGSKMRILFSCVKHNTFERYKEITKDQLLVERELKSGQNLTQKQRLG